LNSLLAGVCPGSARAAQPPTNSICQSTDAVDVLLLREEATAALSRVEARKHVMTLSTVIGASSVLFAFACTIPQLLKLRRVRSASGVSIAALANSTISGIGWTTFGAVHHDLWVALPSLVGIPSTAAAAVLAWHRGAERTRLWLPVAWAVTLAAAAASGPWLGSVPLTAALGFSIALMITPAAMTAWRSHDVSALAANAWVMLIADAMLAGTYGVVAHIAANLVYATVAIVGSATILTRLALPAGVHAVLVPRPVSASDLEAFSLDLEREGELIRGGDLVAA
jgi:uncharacterized protein with PQ loop repeat